jgi:hypothetical protein
MDSVDGTSSGGVTGTERLAADDPPSTDAAKLAAAFQQVMLHTAEQMLENSAANIHEAIKDED